MSLIELAQPQMPRGTRPHRFAAIVIRSGLLSRSISDVRTRLAQDLGEAFVIVAVQADTLAVDERPRELTRLGIPDDDLGHWQVVFGFTYRAVPGQTDFVVLRSSPAVAPGWMPPGTEGKVIARADLPAGPVVVPLTILPARRPGAAADAPVKHGVGEPTGEVEIHDGRVAEVYEVRRPA
ncbi:hypothetical protein [Planomonospora sp. ID82291]|uniref:hypothetical protein n=1 Tax=Planomonospora sp. ID82291 TaxID=2738136 RepID=UPI0018C401E7|nr:hypothetical protein [Planomonospora sp. ID82291]MBG0818348.1 hypothetical protein [Planomonospora sp. ID82291]